MTAVTSSSVEESDLDPEIAAIGAGLRLPNAGKIRVAAYLLSAAGYPRLSQLIYQLNNPQSGGGKEEADGRS